MQAEIKFIPQEGAKSVNKAMVRSYDSQGIIMSENAVFQVPGEPDKDQLQVTIDVPRNGSVEIESESMAEVDNEQKSAVPPEQEQSDQVREELKKKGEDRRRQRDESYRQAALERGLAYTPPLQYPGGTPGTSEENMQKYKEEEARRAGGTPAAPATPAAPHVEHKEGKVDASKNPSSSPGHTPPAPPVRK